MRSFEFDLGELFLCLIFFVAVVLPIFFVLGFGKVIEYHFNKSTCSVFVDQEEVYSGYCHFVTVDSIGENGNTKRVVIYKDSRRWRPEQIYVSDDVFVGEAD